MSPSSVSRDTTCMHLVMYTCTHLPPGSLATSLYFSLSLSPLHTWACTGQPVALVAPDGLCSLGFSSLYSPLVYHISVQRTLAGETEADAENPCAHCGWSLRNSLLGIQLLCSKRFDWGCEAMWKKPSQTQPLRKTFKDSAARAGLGEMVLLLQSAGGLQHRGVWFVSQEHLRRFAMHFEMLLH